MKNKDRQPDNGRQDRQMETKTDKDRERKTKSDKHG